MCKLWGRRNILRGKQKMKTVKLEKIITKEEHDRTIKADSHKWDENRGENVTLKDIGEYLSNRDYNIETKRCVEEVSTGYRGRLQYSVPLETFCLKPGEYCPLQEYAHGRTLFRCNSKQLTPHETKAYWKSHKDDKEEE